MGLVSITIPNWEKYNPRNDRAVHSWFRFQNGFFADQKMFGLSDSQQLLFIFLACECSKNLGGATEVNTAYVAAVRQTPETKIVSDLQALADVGVITLPNGAIELPNGNATNERTNVTNERNVTLTPEPKGAARSGPKASAFVAAYCQKFKLRWGENPQILGKDAGIAKRLAKDLGQDRFEFLLDAFFAMPDAWLVKTKHPIAAFETKLNEIVVFAESGQFHTQRQVREADNSATNALLLAKVQRGEL